VGIRVGSKIKKIRELRDFTQLYMADSIGISQSYYARIENNTVDLSFSKLEKIAEILAIDPLQLLSFDGTQYFQSVSHSQVGSGQYVDQRPITADQLGKYQQELEKLQGEVNFLRKLIEQHFLK